MTRNAVGRAREILYTFGWWQGSLQQPFQRGMGSRDILGALRQACLGIVETGSDLHPGFDDYIYLPTDPFNRTEYEAAREAIEQTIADLYPDLPPKAKELGFRLISLFNDLDHITFDHVDQVLEEAEDRLDPTRSHRT